MISTYAEQLPETVAQASTLIDLLRRRSLQQPEQRAYTFLLDGEVEEAFLTYAELDRQARNIAALLQRLDADGKRVLLLYPPGMEYIAAFFGCLYAGAVAVPAYPPRLNRSLSRLQSIVADAQAAAVLTTSEIHSRVLPLLEHIPELTALHWVATNDFADDIADDWQEPVLNSQSLAFLQYTSGSTAAPRGVMVTHENLLHNQRMIQQTFRQTRESIILGWLPLYHDMGLIGNVLQPLYVGAPCVLMSPMAFLQKPARWLQAISRYRATTSGAPNFAYDLCVRKVTPEQRETLDLSSWTTAFNGAEPVRHATMERFAATFGAYGFRRQAFHPCYGLAEATLLVSGGSNGETAGVYNFQKSALGRNRIVETIGEADDSVSIVSCGQVLPEQKVIVVNPDALTRAPSDQVGEIWLSGQSVTRGYWNRSEETEQTFHAYLTENGEGPYLRTGDLGFLRDGELFITGRLKDLIIIRGRNHYPQDIELTVQQSHPALAAGACAAFSVEVAGEERLVIVQELSHREPNLTALMETVREAVAREHETQVYAIVLIKKRSLPKTSSGKVQRRACRNEFLADTLKTEAEWRENLTGRSEVSTASEIPVSPESLRSVEALKAWLISHLAPMLGVDASAIDVDQPIIRYGLDSLMAVELAHHIESRLDVILPPANVLQDATIAELAEQVLAHLTEASSSAIPTLASTHTPAAEHQLSHGQRGLWFMHQLAPESAAYNISAATRILSDLDVEALGRAFQQLGDRHAALRTTFIVSEEGPVQHVHEGLQLSFSVEDASTWSETTLNEHLVEEAHRPFNLEHGPLLRVSLFRRAAQEHVVLLTVHHIVMDFWSLGVLMRELGALYEAEKESTAVALIPLALDYTDYARWQSEMLAGAEGERLWAYWQERLAGELPVLGLTTDMPRPPSQTFRGASQAIIFDQTLTQELKALSLEHGTTLYVTLLAAFQILLYRYTGQEDVLVGSPTAGRSRAELAALVGYFVNPVVLREDLSGNPAFKTFLGQVRQTVLSAFEHQDYPFSLLVERLQPVRSSNHPPIFQAMFIFQAAQLHSDAALASFALGEAGAQMNLGGLSIESVALQQRVAQVDLALVMAEVDGGLGASLQYSTDLFEAATIKRMLGHLENLLRGIVADVNQRLAELPLLTGAERHQLLTRWNQTEAAYDRYACVHQLFEAQVERTPHAVALVFEDEQLSYQELNGRANQVAHYLRSLGVGAETLVGLCVERSIEMVVGLLGVLKAGGAYVPLDVTYPQERLAFMLEDAQVSVLLTQQRFAVNLASYAARVICLDSDWPSISRHSQLNPQTETTAANLAYVIYTSGSTGKPKGVLIAHRGLCNFAAAFIRALDVRPDSRVLQFASLSFDASVSEIFPALLSGATLCLASTESLLPSRPLIETLRRHLVTIATLSPVVLGALEETEVTSLQTVTSAGEACTAEIVGRWAHGRRMINAYGPTEVTVCATLTEVDERGGTPTIGRAIENTTVYVLDNQQQPTPIGVSGELFISGHGLARGYLNRPDLTAEKFIPNPFSTQEGARLYRTGDLVRYLKNGDLEYLGRLDQQVKIRGFRIELGEVQAALLSHPAVRDCALLVREEVEGDKRLVAYLVLNAESETLATPAELRSYLKQQLPEYMIPSSYVELAELPLTPNGKLDRKGLPAPEQTREMLAHAFVAPRTQSEELLAVIWSHLLGVEQVGIHDNFFELGGHSLLAAQVIARVRDSLSVELPLRTLFESPTIAELSTRIDELSQSSADIGTAAPPLVAVKREGQALPLSYAQQRLWFLQQLEPESAVYNMPAAIKLHGTLDITALSESVREVVTRHEALRTNFGVDSAGEPVQLIQPAPSTWLLPVVDLVEVSEGEREAGRLAQAEAHRPFNLESEPLLRTTLLRISADTHVLLWAMHHIISDGWSMGVLVSEVAALYKAYRSGQSSPLPPLPVQYADYAVWQRKWLTGETLERHLAYWREQLGGAPLPLDLPTDYPRPAVQQFRGAVAQLAFSPQLNEGLRAVGRQTGATLYMVLLAAFKVLLSRYSGQEEVIVGTPVAGRSRVETEALIGFFVNTLVLRTDLSGEPTFVELVRRVREVVLEGQAHGEVPFEKLVEALRPERDLSQTPLFQVMFVLRNTPAVVFELPGLELSPLGGEGDTAKFDLTLSMIEVTEGLVGALEYNTDLFDATTISRMLGHYETLLNAIVVDSEQSIAELPLLTGAERHQLLTEWNQTQADYPSHACVHQLFEAQTERTPHAVALVFEDEQLSYQQLNERANQVAHYLRSLGVGAETLVGLCVERSVEMVVGLLGVLKAGGAYVPLDVTYPQERLAFMLEDTQALVLLTQQHLINALPNHGVRVVCLDTDWEDIAQQSANNPISGVTPDNTAYVIYTSGSTGRPKGVAIEHHSTVTMLEWARSVFAPEDLASVLASTSINFDISIFELFAPLSFGGKVILAENVLHLPSLPAAGEVSLINTVPSAMAELLRVDGVPASVRTVNLAGEALQNTLAQQIYNKETIRHVFNLYGPTEDTTYSTFALVKKGAQEQPPIGRPLANTEMYVLDNQQQPTPIGVSGELFISGHGLARGYLNRPDLTAEKFIPNPFSTQEGARLYRTGDLVRYLQNGDLEYLGRLDQQVKIRGFRIELGEVQAALLSHPGVRDCALIAREDMAGDKRLVAYIVINADVEAVTTPAELRSYLKQQLPEYMIPSSYVELAELPLTPNGKLDRKGLPAPEQTREMLAHAFVAPRTVVEEVIAAVWSEILRQPTIGIHDNFFELGGHSLLAAQVIARLRDALSVELPLRTLFESPTIAELSTRIDELTQDEAGLHGVAPPLIAVVRDGQPLPLSYAQQRLWFLQQLEPESAVYNMLAAVRLHGTLNVAALSESVREVVTRHEALRTTFAALVDGQPVQLIQPPPAAWPLPVVDLSQLKENDTEREVERLAAEQAQRAFDLTGESLLRTTLLRVSADEHALLWAMHHIISDGWSMGVLVKEVAALYEAYSSGQESPLLPLSVQYADYAVWQRAWLTGEVLDTQLAYWREQLGGELPVLELPTDRVRPALQQFRGEIEQTTISVELSGQLQAVARVTGATLYMVLLAAFKVLLSRYSGQEEVIVGTPVAGRSRVETEGLIGFFVNTLVLRTDLSGEPTFRQVIERVRKVTLGAYTHQDVPFEKLLEELRPERNLSRTPLFQVLFNMLNFPESRIKLQGLVIENITPLEVGSKFDLTLYASEQEEGIQLKLVYNTDLFSRARMVEMLEQFKHLLSQVVSNIDEQASRLSLVTTSAARLLPDPTQTFQPYWQGAIQTLFSERAAQFPERLAVRDKQESWTYGELNERSNQLANYLLAGGIQRQDIVAVYGHRSASLVWALLGILKAGATFMVLDPAYPESRLIDYLRAAEPRGWLQIEAAGVLPPALEEYVANLSCSRLTLQQRAVAEAQSFLLGFSIEVPGVAVGAGDLLTHYSHAAPTVEVGPDDVACAVFTSGTTAAPKGVLGRHQSLPLFAHWLEQTFGINEHDRFSMLSGISHDPLQRDIFTPLQLGASLSIPDPNEIGSPGWLAGWMKQEEISVTNLTPAMGQLLTETTPQAAACEIESLRHAFFVGDMLTRRDVSRLRTLAPAVECVNLYGTTETQRAFGYFIPDQEHPVAEVNSTDLRLEKEVLPVGRGIRDVQLLVLSPAEQLAGVGEVGEIYFRSPHLALGYLGDESLTQQRFITNPFTKLTDDRLYKSGDIGRYLPDGNVEMIGRLDQQVKIRGFRIELGEVQAALLSHPAVRDCALLVREETMGDKRLVAYIVINADVEAVATPGELRSYLKQRLPEYMIPSSYVVLEELPLTPNGKLDRKALLAPDRGDTLSGTYIAPQTPREEELAAIWADVLGIEQVGIHDNFFELGGHSLLAAQVIARLRDALSVELPLRTLFESPTIAELSTRIEELSQSSADIGTAAPPLVAVKREGQALPLSYAQQRLWFLQQLEPESAVYNMPAAIKLHGTLDISALSESVREVVTRHEALRTNFALALNGEPMQIIQPAPTSWMLPVVDLSQLNENDTEREVERLAAEQAQRAFNLASDVLLRTTLLRISADTHVLLWAMHHIISDGWSMGVLVKEVAALYEAYSSGHTSPLLPLSVQYADYAVWQRAWLTGEVLDTQLAYWREQLAGAPPSLDLPADHSRPSLQSSRGAHYSMVLPGALISSLEALGRRQGATLFMVMLAALKIVLFKWSGQSDLVVGTVVANRGRRETEQLIGCFMNFLSLRSIVEGEQTALQLLEKVKATVLDAYSHQDCPFEKIVEAVNPDRNANRNPLYNVAFLLQNFPRTYTFSDTLEANILEVEDHSSALDLRLVAEATIEGINLSCEYSTDLFEAETVRLFVESYRTALEAFVEHAEASVNLFELSDEFAASIAVARKREQEQTIAIAATFTAEPVEASLGFWLEKLDPPYKIKFAPYNQVFQQLLDPSSLLSTPGNGINVVLVRFEDWLRYETGGGSGVFSTSPAFEKIEESNRDLLAILRAVGERSTTPHIICLCPPSPHAVADAASVQFFQRLEEEFKSALEDVSEMYVVTSAELNDSYAVANYYDPHGDEIGHLPFTPLFYTALGTMIGRKIVAIKRTAHKVIVLDCDDTLWTGICGEDGAGGIQMDAPRQALQELMVRQQRAGMLICLCSKNNEADVVRVFEERQLEMPLAREHIVAWRINWKSKSENLISLAEELQLGLDSFIFIDDNPLEVAEVRASCPEVLTLQLPVDTNSINRFLDHLWAFDHLKLTETDAQRTKLYQQNAQRGLVRKNSLTIRSFLAELDLKVLIAPALPHQLPRISQLTQRTNQFNAMTIRRSEGDLQKLSNSGEAECLAVEVSDRFGDYGLVGVIIFDTSAEAVNVDTFLLSCRVLGREVEYRMLARLAEIAEARGLQRVDVSYSFTKSNQPVFDFLHGIGADFKKVTDGGFIFQFPLEVAATLPSDQLAEQTIPSDSPVRELPETDANDFATPARLNPTVLNWIATEMYDAGHILQAIEQQKRHVRPRLKEAYVAPRTQSEELLAVIWSHLLGVEQIGIHDNFFELGGHSLLAAQVIARVRDSLSVELPLRTLFESPTIAELSTRIDELSHDKSSLHSLAPPLVPVARDGQSLPLSYAQQRLWFLQQLETESSVYNMPAAIKLHGALDISALSESLREVVTRHESLRTNFAVTVDGEPMQIIQLAPASWSLPVFDLSQLKEHAGEQEVARLAGEQAQQAFDLEADSLLRTTLLRISADTHVLLWAMHHIISDGWSIGVMVSEVAALYEAYRNGQDSPLPPLSVQYADYAVWQRQWLTGETLERHLSYWREQLGGELPVLELPTDRVRPALQQFRGEIEQVRISQTVSAGLRAVGRQTGATLYMVLLAAFKVLLSRYSGQKEVIVGTPVAGRSRVETEALIGFFVNTLVLRTDLSGEPTFVELVRRVREVVLEGQAHGEVPFEKLVEALRPERDLSRSPIFQVAFMFNNATVKDVSSESLSLSMLPTYSGSAKFDLTLSLTDNDEELRGTLEYNTDLYDPATIRRLGAHFKTLLEGVVANPEQRLPDLPLLTAAEEHQLVVGWNSTKKDYERDACVHQLFEAQTERTPHAVALCFEDEQLSYQELNERANQVAHYLRSLGVGAETLVGLCVERSVEMVVGLLGVLKAGGAYVPLDPSYPKQRLSLMVEDAAVSVMLTQQSLVNALPRHAAQVVCLDTDWEVIARKSRQNSSSGVAAANLAYVIYTSGSTGKPKGVQITHQSVVNFLNSMRGYPGLAGDDVLLAVTSLSFDIAGLELFLPLIVGAREVLVSREVASDGVRLREHLQKSKATVMQATPATYRLLLNSGPEDFHGIKILCGGEMFPRELANQLLERGARLWNMYGPTESTIWSAASRVEVKDGPVLIGRPIANTQIYLLDGRLQVVPVGVAGELHIGGDGLTRGYLHRPELTAEKMIPDLFGTESGARLYKTGDLARYRPDGEIEFLGRLDHQVKVRGHRIELGEIETVLSQHEAVRESVVVTHEDAPGINSLIGYVVPAAGRPAPTISELRNFLRDVLPDYMIPSNLIMLEALPLTPNGKIDRRALPGPDGTRPAVETLFVAPQSEVERTIANIWQEVLKLEKVGIHDNFFELGGHSLLATRIVTRLRDTFHLKLPLRILFESPTVARLSQLILEKLAEEFDDDMLASLEKLSSLEVEALLAGDATAAVS